MWIEIPITYAITVAPAVVPYAGTWIEMSVEDSDSLVDDVVPHEGTWIEISTQRDSWRLKGSFPTWERELK